MKHFVLTTLSLVLWVNLLVAVPLTIALDGAPKSLDPRYAVDANGMRITQVLLFETCLLYTSPSPRDGLLSRMPSSA